MCQYFNDSVLEINMFFLLEKLPQKLTQKDIVKWKYKVSRHQPCNCHIAKHTELHLQIHMPDVLLSG